VSACVACPPCVHVQGQVAQVGQVLRVLKAGAKLACSRTRSRQRVATSDVSSPANNAASSASMQRGQRTS
jgi:hypothetical protein